MGPPLDSDSFRRWLGLFGLGLAVVSAATWVIAPIHVSSGELVSELGTHYETHRTALLAFGLAAALGNALHAVFYAALQAIVEGDRLAQALARLGLDGAVADEGILSPAGTIAFVVPMLFFSWFAAVGYELVRAPRPRTSGP